MRQRMSGTTGSVRTGDDLELMVLTFHSPRTFMMIMKQYNRFNTPSFCNDDYNHSDPIDLNVLDDLVSPDSLLRQALRERKCVL